MRNFRDLVRPAKAPTFRFLSRVKQSILRLIRRFTRIVSVLSLLLDESIPHRITDQLGSNQYFTGNGLRPSFSKFSLICFALFSSPQIEIVAIGNVDEQFKKWFKRAEKYMQASENKFDYVSGANIWTKIARAHISNNQKRSMLLVLPGNSLPTMWDIFELLLILHKFSRNETLGAVQPSYLFGETKINGLSFDRSTEKLIYSVQGENLYQQDSLAKYVYSVTPHSAVFSNEFIETVVLKKQTHEDIHSEFLSLCQAGIESGWKFVCTPQITVKVQELPEPQLSKSELSFLTDRNVKSLNQKVRIIFVLPATTLSGGIRVVFEKAHGLKQLGYETEIWSLVSGNDWNEFDIPIVRFKNYTSLSIALSKEEAIKVATWWETGNVVFLGSLQKGIPVQFVQEFETWFYPGDKLARAAVVSSYRPEFKFITIAEYQHDELNNIGISATICPVGYHSETYFEIEGVSRDKKTVVSLGRSFFQKNFEMTAKAWKLLNAQNKKLVLFGQEPNILTGDGIEYVHKPSNDAVNEIYNRGTIFVQTSRHEGFCLPIIEAMAAGCAVITTDSHGNRGFCKDGINCLIVDHDDYSDLAKKMEILLENEDLRNSLRNEAIKTAKEYSWNIIMKKYFEIYGKIASNESLSDV